MVSTLIFEFEIGNMHGTHLLNHTLISTSKQEGSYTMHLLTDKFVKPDMEITFASCNASMIFVYQKCLT